MLGRGRHHAGGEHLIGDRHRAGEQHGDRRGGEAGDREGEPGEPRRPRATSADRLFDEVVRHDRDGDRHRNAEGEQRPTRPAEACRAEHQEHGPVVQVDAVRQSADPGERSQRQQGADGRGEQRGDDQYRREKGERAQTPTRQPLTALVDRGHERGELREGGEAGGGERPAGDHERARLVRQRSSRRRGDRA